MNNTYQMMMVDTHQMMIDTYQTMVDTNNVIYNDLAEGLYAQCKCTDGIIIWRLANLMKYNNLAKTQHAKFENNLMKYLDLPKAQYAQYENNLMKYYDLANAIYAQCKYADHILYGDEDPEYLQRHSNHMMKYYGYINHSEITQRDVCAYIDNQIMLSRPRTYTKKRMRKTRTSSYKHPDESDNGDYILIDYENNFIPLVCTSSLRSCNKINR